MPLWSSLNYRHYCQKLRTIRISHFLVFAVVLPKIRILLQVFLVEGIMGEVGFFPVLFGCASYIAESVKLSFFYCCSLFVFTGGKRFKHNICFIFHRPGILMEERKRGEKCLFYYNKVIKLWILLQAIFMSGVS